MLHTISSPPSCSWSSSLSSTPSSKPYWTPSATSPDSRKSRKSPILLKKWPSSNRKTGSAISAAGLSSRYFWLDLRFYSHSSSFMASLPATLCSVSPPIKWKASILTRFSRSTPALPFKKLENPIENLHCCTIPIATLETLKPMPSLSWYLKPTNAWPMNKPKPTVWSSEILKARLQSMSVLLYPRSSFTRTTKLL